MATIGPQLRSLDVEWTPLAKCPDEMEETDVTPTDVFTWTAWFVRRRRPAAVSSSSTPPSTTPPSTTPPLSASTSTTSMVCPITEGAVCERSGLFGRAFRRMYVPETDALRRLFFRRVATDDDSTTSTSTAKPSMATDATWVPLDANDTPRHADMVAFAIEALFALSFLRPPPDDRHPSDRSSSSSSSSSRSVVSLLDPPIDELTLQDAVVQSEVVRAAFEHATSIHRHVPSMHKLQEVLELHGSAVAAANAVTPPLTLDRVVRRIGAWLSLAMNAAWRSSIAHAARNGSSLVHEACVFGLTAREFAAYMRAVVAGSSFNLAVQRAKRATVLDRACRPESIPLPNWTYLQRLAAARGRPLVDGESNTVVHDPSSAASAASASSTPSSTSTLQWTDWKPVYKFGTAAAAAAATASGATASGPSGPMALFADQMTYGSFELTRELEFLMDALCAWVEAAEHAERRKDRAAVEDIMRHGASRYVCPMNFNVIAGMGESPPDVPLMLQRWACTYETANELVDRIGMPVREDQPSRSDLHVLARMLSHAILRHSRDTTTAPPDV